MDFLIVDLSVKPILGLEARASLSLISRINIKSPAQLVVRVEEGKSQYKKNMENKRQAYKYYYDRKARKSSATFNKGESLVYRNEKKWQPAMIVKEYDARTDSMIK